MFLHGTRRWRVQSCTCLLSQNVPPVKAAGTPYSQLGLFPSLLLSSIGEIPVPVLPQDQQTQAM